VVDTLTIFQEKGRSGGAIVIIKQKINVNWKLRFHFFSDLDGLDDSVKHNQPE